MRYAKLILVLAVVLAAANPAGPAGPDSAGTDRSVIRNVIVLIGDGMGIGQVTAAQCGSVGSNGRLALDGMPVTGLVLTHPLGGLVTDSAAAATALATGAKTDNGRISMLADGTRLRTIAETARSLGKSTGIVTTEYVTGATVAAFVAHVPNRGQRFDLAALLLASRTDAILGGGRRYFLPGSVEGGDRPDDRDLLAEARKRGYEVLSTAAELDTTCASRVLGLFSSGSLEGREGEPTLAQMVAKAAELLGRNRRGFFLVAEESGTDGAGHSNNAEGVVAAVRSLDDALRAALDFAKRDGNTLVLVTSDHDTGGLAVKDGGGAGFKAAWIGGGHTGNMVAVYAYGPGSERFTGTHDNTDIPKLIERLMR